MLTKCREKWESSFRSGSTELLELLDKLGLLLLRLHLDGLDRLQHVRQFTVMTEDGDDRLLQSEGGADLEQAPLALYRVGRHEQHKHPATTDGLPDFIRPGGAGLDGERGEEGGNAFGAQIGFEFAGEI